MPRCSLAAFSKRQTSQRGGLDHTSEKSPAVSRGAFDVKIVKRMKRSVLGRPGGDLLFQALRLSTIGAEDFDGRVRDGIGYRLLAIATRSAKDGTVKQAFASERAVRGLDPRTSRRMRWSFRYEH